MTAGIRTTGNHDIDQATAEIAVYLRDSNPALRDQQAYDEAMRLRDEIMSGTRRLDAKRRSFQTPAWLHERVNDPYGTPNKHEFWSGPIGCTAERIGVWKVFTYGGWVHGYDTQHNAWAHFATQAEAEEHCSKPAIDPWA